MSDLFRKEAMANRRRRLEGTVVLRSSPIVLIVSLVLSAAVLAAAVFAAVVPISRQVSLSGELVPGRGLIAVASDGAAIIRGVAVQDGQAVVRGQPLVTLASSGSEAAFILAPVDGEVWEITAPRGAVLNPGDTVALLSTGEPAVEAEFLVDQAAAALLQPGQAVNLRYDALSSTRFGVQRGRVRWVSRAPASLPDGQRGYRVRVEPDRQGLGRVGAERGLRVGMTVNASVVIGRETLLQKIFDPLRSAQ